MTFLDLLDNKNKYEKILIDLLSSYCFKYINKIFIILENDKNIYKNFQYKLVKISEWDTDKQIKEYKKWIKWCHNKKNYKEQKLQNIFNMYLLISIQIITYDKLNSQYQLIDNNFPEFYKIFYKCLKNIAKYFYENPKILNNTSYPNNNIQKIVKYQLQKILPFNKILNILKTPNDKPIFIEYDFDNTYSEDLNKSDKNSNNIDQINNNSNLIIEKENNNEIDDHFCHNDLNYINSDDFDNEYYESSHSTHIMDTENDIKHINMPKNGKHNKNNKNKN